MFVCREVQVLEKGDTIRSVAGQVAPPWSLCLRMMTALSGTQTRYTSYWAKNSNSLYFKRGSGFFVPILNFNTFVALDRKGGNSGPEDQIVGCLLKVT